MIVVLLLAATSIACGRHGGHADAGVIEFGAPSGAGNSFDPDSSLTEGWTIFQLTHGPIKIIDIRPRSTGTPVTILGYLVRRIGVNADAVAFDFGNGYPPGDSDK